MRSPSPSGRAAANSSVSQAGQGLDGRGLGFEGGRLLAAGPLDDEAELVLGRDLVLGPDRPRLDDDRLDEGHGLLGGLVAPARLGHREGRDDDGLAGPGQVLPDLLGDEGHEGMEQLQDAVEGVGQHGLGRRVALAQADLGELDVPVAELVPDEMVDEVGRLVELVLARGSASSAAVTARSAGCGSSGRRA